MKKLICLILLSSVGLAGSLAWAARTRGFYRTP